MLAADSRAASGGEEEEDVSECEKNRVETNSRCSSEPEDESDWAWAQPTAGGATLTSNYRGRHTADRHWMVFMKYAKIKTPHSKGFKVSGAFQSPTVTPGQFDESK